MPTVRDLDPDLDRLITEVDTAREAKERAELRRNRFKVIANTIKRNLAETRAEYEAEIIELSDEVGYWLRKIEVFEDNGAPRRAIRDAEEEADKLLARRNMLASERRTLKALLRSTYDALKSAEEKYAVLLHNWQVAHAELQRYRKEGRALKGGRQLHPRLARRFMERAGLPTEYVNSAVVVRDHDGERFHIYFGGVGEAVGPGHGHFVFSSTHGINVYERMPVGDDE